MNFTPKRYDGHPQSFTPRESPPPPGCNDDMVYYILYSVQQQYTVQTFQEVYTQGLTADRQMFFFSRIKDKAIETWCPPSSL